MLNASGEKGNVESNSNTLGELRPTFAISFGRNRLERQRQRAAFLQHRLKDFPRPTQTYHRPLPFYPIFQIRALSNKQCCGYTEQSGNQV